MATSVKEPDLQPLSSSSIEAHDYLESMVSEELTARNLLNSFSEYARNAWSLVDPSPLEWGWFLDVLCGECEQWARGNHRNLAIAVPPGFGKSLIASVLLPTWMWAREPTVQFLCCSHSQALATRDSVKARNLLRSPWYQNNFVRNRWFFSKDQDQKTQYRTSLGGARQALGGKTNLLGWRGDKLIFDDPIDINPRKPPRREDLETAYEWVQTIRNTRINHPKTAQSLLIMQRVDPRDPIGRMLEDEAENWNVVCFDLEYDRVMPFRHLKDTRKEHGELLFPERVGIIEAKRRRIAQGLEAYSAQNQQMPITASGSIISPAWFIRYDDHPRNRDLTQYDFIIGSWDCAFLKKKTSSWVVGTVWGVKNPTSLDARVFDLLDVQREHLSYTETRAAIRRQALDWPELDIIIVENKANGPAIVDDLRTQVPNLVEFDPTPYGEKEQRLRAVASIFEAGRVRVPKEAPWLDAYIKELTYFPKIDNDDQVDSTTQTLLGCLYHLPSWLKHTNKQGPRVYGGWG